MWTEKYAIGNPYEEKILNLLEMGFDRERAQNAIEKCGGDQNKALNLLLDGWNFYF